MLSLSDGCVIVKKIYTNLNGRTKPDNDGTNSIVLRQIVHTLFKCNFTHWDPLDAIDRLVERFRFPLEGAAAEVSEIRGEFETMVEYATQFISLSTMEYQSVWWRLFHAPNSSEWSNVLCLASLLFSLPVSNGKLERAFSQVNLKNSKRTSLGNDTLNDLLVLNTDKVPLQDFSPEAPIDLWWDAKTRKPSHGPRKQYKKRTPHGQTSVVQTSDTENSKEEEEEDKLLLDDWDEWMQDVCDSD